MRVILLWGARCRRITVLCKRRLSRLRQVPRLGLSGLQYRYTCLAVVWVGHQLVSTSIHSVWSVGQCYKAQQRVLCPRLSGAKYDSHATRHSHWPRFLGLSRCYQGRRHRQSDYWTAVPLKMATTGNPCFNGQHSRESCAAQVYSSQTMS